MADSTQKTSTVNLQGQGLSFNVNTSAHTPHKVTDWPFGPDNPLEGQGDALTALQVEQVALRLRTNANKSYYKHFTEEQRDKYDATGRNLYDEYAKKYGTHYIAEVVKETIDNRPAIPKEKHLSYNDARQNLSAVEKDAPGNAMLPQLRGAFGGESEQSYRILNSGVAIVRYRDFKEFDKDVYRSGDQRDLDNDLTSITNTKFRSLVSAVEIAPQNEPPSYRIVVSDGSGVRVNSIKKEDFDKLIEHNKDHPKSKDLTEQQKLGNRKKFIDTILEEYTPLRTPLSKLEGARSALLKQVQNDKLFGVIPLPGILGGRKDRLKRACKTANFTFSEKDGIVIDQNKFRPYRKTITINGQNNEDAYIDLGNDCSVKVNANGKIEEDTIYKLEKDGSRSKIDIKGDIFRTPLTLNGPLVDSMKKPMTKIGKFLDTFNLNFFSDDHKAARKRARDVMSAYKKLELIVCTNPNNSNDKTDRDSEKTLGLTFMAFGKTHGLRFSKREKIATTITATGLAVGASVASAGLAGISAAGAGVAGGVAGISGLSAGAGVKDVIDDNSTVTVDNPIRTRKTVINKTHESGSSRQ